jgi:hypothetical protein
MGASTSVAKRSRTGAALASLVLWSTTAAGCVLGDDTDGPVLAVDLKWDRSPSERFSEGSCDSAGVVWMNWTLRDSDGDALDQSPDDGTDCENGFDFFGLRPGDYALEVEGYDEADDLVWEGTCQKLRLDRFDKLYTCRVNQIEQEAEPETDE